MQWIENLNNRPAEAILSLAIILFAGFLVTRPTKMLHLPNVTGYILAGILIGPYALNLIPAHMIQSMSFITDIALAYIAFGVGKFFKLSKLRRNGTRVIVLTLCEALLTAGAIACCMIFIFRLSVPVSLLLGAIAATTAPASTMMTIRQYQAKGEFVDTLLQVSALDNTIALISFSICAAIAGALQSGGSASNFQLVARPFLLNVIMVALGAACGYVLKWIITDRRSREHRLVLVNAVIFLLTGICTALDISPLLACMMMGTVYVNLLCAKRRIFKEVNHFTAPIMLLFFVFSGMRLNLPMLRTTGVVGVVYFLVRIAGKYLGAYCGAALTRMPPGIRRYLGLALIPQAGVSIGLAALAQRLLPTELGAMLSTIVLSAGVLYEIVGPACAKASLFLSHSIAPPNAPQSPVQAAVPEIPASTPQAAEAPVSAEANTHSPPQP